MYINPRVNITYHQILGGSATNSYYSLEWKTGWYPIGCSEHLVIRAGSERYLERQMYSHSKILQKLHFASNYLSGRDSSHRYRFCPGVEIPQCFLSEAGRTPIIALHHLDPHDGSHPFHLRIAKLEKTIPHCFGATRPGFADFAALVMFEPTLAD